MKIEDLFQAYYDCRKTKRNSIQQIRFELNFESNLFTLFEKIVSKTYRPNKYIAFIFKEKGKLREVFAPSFEDRIVHHLIRNKLEPYIDGKFIYDSYACRTGKGPLFGIRRLEKFIRSCSRNYTKTCYILKLDIKSYFTSINRDVLYAKILNFVGRYYLEDDIDILLDLIYKVIYTDPVKNCKIVGDKSEWNELPKSKSLFYAGKNKGLPIGNLTSQLFSNIYLDSLDKFIKYKLGIKYYGRYVDDFALLHENKEYLKFCKYEIDNFVKSKLDLTLHPGKVYLVNYKKGVYFLGAYIKPYRIYISNKTKKRFIKAVGNKGKKNYLNSINSYLGLMRHFKTYKLRRKYVLSLLKYGFKTDKNYLTIKN